MPSTTWGAPSGVSTDWSANLMVSSLSTAVSLVRTATGLLAWSCRSADNDGSIASRTTFRTADWQVRGQSAGGVDLASTGELRYTAGSFNLHNTIRNLSVGTLVEALVQARTKVVGSSGAMLSAAPSVRIQDTGATGSSTVRHVAALVPSGISANHGISEYHDGNTDLTPSTSSVSIAVDTVRRVTVWCDAATKAMHDITQGVGYSAAINQSSQSGRPGLNFRDATGGSAGQLQCAEWLACSGRYVVVSGASLADGWRAVARRSSASAIASATVSNGSAKIDLLAQTLDGGIVDVVVEDANGSVLATLAPGGTGIWPGDELAATVEVTGTAPVSWAAHSAVSTSWSSV